MGFDMGSWIFLKTLDSFWSFEKIIGFWKVMLCRRSVKLFEDSLILKVKFCLFILRVKCC